MMEIQHQVMAEVIHVPPNQDGHESDQVHQYVRNEAMVLQKEMRHATTIT